MADQRSIASSLGDNELAVAISDMVEDRWNNWDLAPYLALLVDVCAPSVLPYLAEMFDVEGLQGFAMAENQQQEREIIKRSIALHKYMGTPWAIREACRTVGFPVIVLEEGVKSNPPDKNDWARFRVLVDAETNRHISVENARKLRQFVEYYKNERSHLVELGFYQGFADDLFRRDLDDRDELHLDILMWKIEPCAVALTPDGAERIATVTANCPWELPAVLEWPDGSGDKLYFESTGEAGETAVKITSDPNKTDDRTITVRVYHPTGFLLGSVTVKQPHKWRNAYSRAYSNAYCSIPRVLRAYSIAHGPAYSGGKPAVRLSADNLFLSERVPDTDIYVMSNTKWETE